MACRRPAGGRTLFAMNPRIGLFAALLALVALGIGAFFKSGGEAPEDSTGETVAPVVEAPAEDLDEPSTALPDVVAATEGGREALAEVAPSAPAATTPAAAAPTGPAFVAGRVVDAFGAAVPRAKVVMRAAPEAGAALREVNGLQLTTDADGNFRREEPLVGSAFELAGMAPGWAGTWQSFDVSATDVLVTLQRGGAISGSFELDGGVALADLELRLVRGHDQQPRSAVQRVLRPRDGEPFAFAPLLPGMYDVQVMARGRGEPLTTVEDIEVREGETSPDERLRPLDLRGALRAFSITLETPGNDAPFLQGTLKVLHSESGRELSQQMLALRDVRVVAASSVVDVEIQVAGYRREVLTGVSGARSVTLRSGLPVRVALIAEGELATAPDRLCVVLQPADGERTAAFTNSEPALNEGGEVLLKVPGPGTYKVTWVYQQRSGGNRIFMREFGQEIEVLDSGAEQRFELPLTPEQMKVVRGEAQAQ